MKNGYNIERLITLLSCSHCNEGFDESCISLLEINYDTVMVKIVCKNCGRKYILAFMDLNFSFFDATLGNTSFETKTSKSESFEPDKAEKKEEILYESLSEDYIFDPGLYFENIKDIKTNTNKNLDKITYDDVLEAHDFIQNFEENWRRYMEKRKYGIT